MELWLAGASESTTSARIAQQREAEGWDGQMFMDSQSLSADPYVMMGAWAVATERLKLCTSTTNPLTRHPVVTAAAAATLQSISGGRAILGIGRGDSALAYLGYAPARLTMFRNTLENLQTLLRGGEVEFSEHQSLSNVDSAESLSLGDRPSAARLQWLPEGMPKVPLDVAATGPKVISMAATIAERVTLSVGAIPDRLQWALDIANQARATANVEHQPISYGAQVIVVCHPEPETVMDAATSFVAPLARFQVIQGSAKGPQDNKDAANLAAIRENYRMSKHGQKIAHDKLGNVTLDPDFVKRFAIVGTPDQCTQRLLELYRLGIERFVVVGPGFYLEPKTNGGTLFAEEVIPALRAAI